MVIKYYGTSTHEQALIQKLWFTDPYKRTNELRPSYCVWIVPGTVDHNGNHVD